MPSSQVLDLFSDTSSSPSSQVFLNSSQCNGLQVSGNFIGKVQNQFRISLTFMNQSETPMNDFAIQFNVNRSFIF